MGQSAEPVATSPYPRKFALGSENMRPAPQPLGARIAADVWTLCLGAIYGVVSIIPHWSVAIGVPLIFVWRAYRVERTKVDFCSRTIALALVSWTAIVFSLRDVFSFILVADYRGSPSDNVWISGTLAVLLAVVWLGAMIWRRLNRHELEPGGFYESFRAGVPWFLIPAAAMMMGMATEMAQFGIGPVIASLVTYIGVVSFRMGRTVWERVGTALGGVLLLAPSAARETYPEPTPSMVDVAVLGGFAAIALMVLFVGSMRRREADPLTEQLPSFVLPVEEVHPQA